MFRRLIGTELWHSEPECSFWPKYNFEEKENPTTTNLCKVCIAIASAKGRRSEDDKKPK